MAPKMFVRFLVSSRTRHRRCAEFSIIVSVVVVLASIATWTSGAARATTFAPEAFDTTILGADAVVVATVDLIKPDPTNGVSELLLRDVDVITTRIDLGPDFRSLHVAAHGRGGPDTSESVCPSPMDAAIETGHRYFFFLRGGAWRDWPLVARLLPFEVRDDVVHCQGGEVYGIDPMGVLCGVASDYASAPLSESAFEHQIAHALLGARARRPAAAASADGAARPLERAPSARLARVAP